MAEKETIQETENDMTEAAFGPGNEVPEPASTGSTKRPADKEQGEKAMPKLSKAAMMSAAVTAMSKMNSSDMAAAHAAVMAKAPARKADKAGGEPMPKLSMAEDVQEMFAGQELSEEFIDNATTIFEAAVNARLVVEQARMQEESDAALNEALDAAKEELAQKVDDYLTYAVEEWVKDNQIAIESSLKSEITESFIQGLKGLFESHYIDVPEEKLDVLGQLSAKVEELEGKLDEQITTNIDLKGQLDEVAKLKAVAEVSEGLAMTQAEKFAILAEGVEFQSVESYKKKLEVIRENYFNKTEKKPALLEEEVIAAEPEAEASELKLDPAMEKYVSSISRTVKK